MPRGPTHEKSLDLIHPSFTSAKSKIEKNTNNKMSITEVIEPGTRPRFPRAGPGAEVSYLLKYVEQSISPTAPNTNPPRTSVAVVETCSVMQG